ncbi:TPA_asm: hypothetical protein HUJ06_019167 [Nelumbo nucifera]|uniref:Uncharacterized protein n=1 Tax=Nelumbo nucifera TaxID=4432 RepID=A0A822Y9N3_NELNU|nr:TPA_asm: hypothetical protein HUJ06_030728 [Nelumbo nucifera]DAD32838.1 TPA_asm: hypothetical protein HUJ06_011689 [Nelumbo nucifera]DAD37202.1 TPA_asm: hypothetical protein HUJ06_007843 [Nelumbo nucifera]DAD37204.1 TPA_asm: hypothetical protein HUJ06_007845 [Nelumbo nucifera]DAD45802.1 TPA_asm: hypothetical protein HUJ06_004032 [Nelumbo nucifera]
MNTSGIEHNISLCLFWRSQEFTSYLNLPKTSFG